jgi:inositol hexakisphosphate/diphosphoinositol-pentakisphosphate kinase
VLIGLSIHRSPVVDGIVRRNSEGKEVRYVTELLPEEEVIAKKICKIFSQTVCGFDLLRVNGKSYVIDVNGWSFVKGNDEYYDMCARTLRDIFLSAARKRRAANTRDSSVENQWKLKGFFAVLRHGDRRSTSSMAEGTSFLKCLFFSILHLRHAKAKAEVSCQQSTVSDTHERRN